MLLLLFVSNFTLHRNTNGESYNDIDETTDTTESEVEIIKKRGQPRQKGESGNKDGLVSNNSLTTSILNIIFVMKR